jgi:hypothetical protein
VNYRPISLLTVGYKVLATMVHARIVQGGSEDRIRDSQFGFRRSRSVIDAIFMVQRLIDGAWEGRENQLSIIFLDWSKAFDKVDPLALIEALRRFGIPEKMVKMIAGIYAKRSFIVKDQGCTSKLMDQGSGIAQGCPLSPYLFVIMLTVVFADLEEALTTLGLQEQWVDVAYADDVALSSSNPIVLQIVLDCLIRSASLYGLKPNWEKTVHMRSRHENDLYDPSGAPIKAVSQATYLGSFLSADGKADYAVGRRIGEARGALKKLQVVWSHANLTRVRKLEIFDACIMSKLLFSLEPMCLKLKERNRIDGFQAQALRRILGIPHSMFSHVSNDAVRQAAKRVPASLMLHRRQLILFGKIALANPRSCLRTVLFKPYTNEPIAFQGIRKRGRPRLTWARVVHARAIQLVGSQLQLDQFFRDMTVHQWKCHVKHAYRP